MLAAVHSNRCCCELHYYYFSDEVLSLFLLLLFCFSRFEEQTLERLSGISRVNLRSMYVCGSRVRASTPHTSVTEN